MSNKMLTKEKYEKVYKFLYDSLMDYPVDELYLYNKGVLQ